MFLCLLLVRLLVCLACWCVVVCVVFSSLLYFVLFLCVCDGALGCVVACVRFGGSDWFSLV